MRPMNAFAAARLDMAIDGLDGLIGMLDGPVDRAARVALQQVRGHLFAMRQLHEMEDEMVNAKQGPTAIKLSLVKR